MTQTEATAATARLSMENERLRAELRELVDELRACRGRMGDAINAERRRVERDLHDGTQGRLVSVAMSLGLLEAKLPGDPSAAMPIAREARRALARALQELRELSRGIHPAALTERGLGAALQELAERAALPAYVELSVDSRPPWRVEAAAYFAVSEALTNAAKHSQAGEVRIAVSYEEPVLVAEVVDDGIGGAAAGRGSGLQGLTDRVQALGGRLIVSSPPGLGTTVRVEIPCRVGIRSAAVRLPASLPRQRLPASPTAKDSGCPAGQAPAGDATSCSIPIRSEAAPTRCWQ
jgi:signal transduction histidine kinase